MLVKLPKPDYRARLVLIALGFGLLVWISLEDTSALSPAILAVVLANSLISYWLLGRIGGRDFPLRLFLFGLPVLGAFSGAASAFAATLLMFFKTAWHAHPYPDYPPEMMLAMISRLPAWAFAGGMIALAFSFFTLLIHPKRET